MTRFSTAITSVLTLILLGSLVQFAPTVGAATGIPVAANPRTGDTFETVQAALDSAAAGDTITVLAGNQTAATYATPLTIAQNGVTLCATLALGVCADKVHGSRWEISQPNNAAWADPPVAWQGAAVRITGGAGSTSHYPNSQNPASTAPKFHVSDIHALSFDMLLESGTCGGGSPRIQFGVDTNGDGVKDLPATLSVYPEPSGFCPAPGHWAHVDLMNARWVHSVGSGGTTRAQAVSNYGSYPIVTMNLIWDGSTSPAWFDNERLNDDVYRDPADANCPDPEAPACTTAQALPNAILANGVTITGNDVTLQGFTIKNPDTSSATHVVTGVSSTGTNTRIVGNDIEGNGPRAVQSTRDSPEFGVLLNGAGFEVANNTIANWAHTGVYVSAGPGLLADNQVHRNRANALYLEDGGAIISILRNDLTQATGANIRVDSRGFVAHENTFGVSQFTIDFDPYAAPVIDARYNHWGAFNRSNIDATIHEDAPGHTVIIDCYYDAQGAAICPPTAAFTASTTTPARHQIVSFTDQSTPGQAGKPTPSWEFGDGATGTGFGIQHAFANPGVYAVTLTSTDAEGGKTTATHSIAVSNTAPTLASIADKTASEGANLAFQLVSTDAEHDAIAYSYAPTIAGANLNPTTGAFSWTPSYVQAGVYDITVKASDGAAETTQPVHIDVANVDRAPIMVPLAPARVLVGGSLTRTVTASDPDGDAVALAATNVPAWATFADLGSGHGSFTGTPAVGDVGTTTITVTATSGALFASRTLVVTVAAPGAFTLVRDGAQLTHASPGDVLQLNATITNAGLATDSYTFAVANSAHWAISGPASVTLAPGDSATVTTTVTVPVGSQSTVTLRATSVGDPTLSKVVTRYVDVPATVAVTMTKAAPAVTESPSGVVKVQWANGAPAVGIRVTITQTSLTLNAAGPTSVSGTTGADGTLAFDFGNDLLARLPGGHALQAIASTPLTAAGQASYTVGAT